MIIGFTGTRKIDLISKERIKVLEAWLNLFILAQEHEFVHGGAIGADELVHNILTYSQEKIGGAVVGDIFEEYKPIIKVRFGGDSVKELRGTYDAMTPEPYLTRNKKIVDECDILIALPIDKDVEELRSGTWATIRYARKQNKKVIVI